MDGEAPSGQLAGITGQREGQIWPLPTAHRSAASIVVEGEVTYRQRMDSGLGPIPSSVTLPCWLDASDGCCAQLEQADTVVSYAFRERT